MSVNHKLNKIFKHSKKILIDDSSKFVIMSDCHRGIGNNDDNFIKNENIFEAALLYYDKNQFTYVELGDGDEMWEVKNYEEIVKEHIDTFKQLKKFHQDNRLIMIYGNHDLEKKSKDVLKKNFYYYNNKITNEQEALLVDLNVHESVILDYDGNEIFLIHGHQVDFLNSTLWHFTRFLVRYIWCHLERLVTKDPTNAAKNYRVTKSVERKFEKWSIDHNKILIAGHTHRPIFPKIGQSLYFNDGSCIHPNGITCIEIENGNISLVKWEYQVESENIIKVGRKKIEGPEAISKFF